MATPNNDNPDISLETNDPGAMKPARKQNALKKLLGQLQSTGSPPLEGEEILPAKLHGDGDYHWYPIAWLRWLAHWEQFKTLFLVALLLGMLATLAIISKRDSIQVNLPQLAVEKLLAANKFSDFDQRQVSSFLCFAVQAANQRSVEGSPTLNLLEGSIDPATYTFIQQRGGNGLQQVGVASGDIPIYTIYISSFTRWSYNPAKREVSVYIKGFRIKQTINGDDSMEPYRAEVQVLLEPTSNRNKWGFYLSKFAEYYGSGAETMDAEIQRRDHIGY